MSWSNVNFLDLPNEILFIILKELGNMDVLYSLLNVDNQRLDMVVQEKMLTENLNFVLTTSTDDIFPIADNIIDRFCKNILPKINLNIKSLILESGTMERILLAVDYPNLTEIKLFNFTDKIFSHYFKVKSPFHRIFPQQIIDLILVYKESRQMFSMEQYTKELHKNIFNFFKNLQHLSINGSCLFLSFRNLPLTTCSSLNLKKLCVGVKSFEDCLALLDGRLKELTTFILEISNMNDKVSTVYNMDDLPNLKCFSLICDCSGKQYDVKIVPLLRRMFNLEELTLNIIIEDRTRFIDGTHLKNEVFVRMPQLYKFTFHISTETKLQHLVHGLSSDDIQKTFSNIGYEQVACVINYCYRSAECHIFSLPPVFDTLHSIGNTFPFIVFSYVTSLQVHDDVPFKHEFFLRVAKFFPSLKRLNVLNIKSESQISDNIASTDNQLSSIVEYPHLISLHLGLSHTDYYEQFLNNTRTHLPRLTQLKVNYKRLTFVTENFTRDATRLNCTNVKRLLIREQLVHSKDFYIYFPVVTSFCTP
ncbi:unnamed protein product [Rotaria socialis]|uniref:F-box domain-containing protein n=1 Tax=Rotaria socialis TaxID=392032 RepID=A0A818ZA94_9BILA|nr:unnamed protein product [Rotaria socialis]CAF4464288.1 unnamed protein product [Rotaria socialis]